MGKGVVAGTALTLDPGLRRDDGPPQAAIVVPAKAGTQGRGVGFARRRGRYAA